MFKLVGVVVVLFAIAVSVAYGLGLVRFDGNVSITKEGQQVLDKGEDTVKGAAADVFDALKEKVK